MGPLSQALNSIALNERKAALEDLVANGLQDQDIRFLIERLKKETDRFIKDICAYPKLPMEILMCISKFLPLEDVLRARLVSKLWNAKFFGEEVRMYLVKVHFRTTWEREYMPLRQDDLEQRLLVRTRFMSWFPEQAKRQIRWERGHHHRRVLPIHPVDREVPPEGQRQYSNGRIAFKTGSGIAVQSLNANYRPLIFRDKDRQKLGKWHLSDQLLVAKKASELAVYAWPLPAVTMAMDNTSETISSEIIRIPSDVRHISAHRDQIGLILAGSDIMIWQFGGGTKLLDCSKINTEYPLQKPAAFGLLFHPINYGHFFVFYQWEIDEYQRRIVVLEVQGDGTQQSVPFDSLIQEDDWAKSVPGSPSKVTATVRTIDPDGLCIISWETTPPTRACRLLTFDLYEKKFAFYPPAQYSVPFRLTRGLTPTLSGEIHECIINISDISQTLIWRNSLLIPAFPGNPTTPKTSKFKDTILIRVCPFKNIESLTWVVWGDRGGGQYASGEGSRGEKDWHFWTVPPIVCGDDDYVVLFGEVLATVWTMNAKTRKDEID